MFVYVRAMAHIFPLTPCVFPRASSVAYGPENSPGRRTLVKRPFMSYLCVGVVWRYVKSTPSRSPETKFLDLHLSIRDNSAHWSTGSSIIPCPSRWMSLSSSGRSWTGMRTSGPVQVRRPWATFHFFFLPRERSDICVDLLMYSILEIQRWAAKALGELESIQASSDTPIA